MAGRTGVGSAEVAAAMSKLVAEGTRVTVAAIRAMTKGSLSTVHRYLRELREAPRGRPLSATPIRGELSSAIFHALKNTAAEAGLEVQKATAENDLLEANSRLTARDDLIRELSEKLGALQERLRVASKPEDRQE